MRKHPKQSEHYILFSKTQGKNHIILNISVGAQSLSLVWLFVTPWTVTRQAPLSRGFSRQEYWSGLPFPSPGDLPDSELNPHLHISWIAGEFFTSEPPWMPSITLEGHNWVDVGGEWEGWKLREFFLGQHRGEVWAIHCLGTQRQLWLLLL